MTKIQELEANFKDQFKYNMPKLESDYFHCSELSKPLLINYLTRLSGSDKNRELDSTDLSKIFIQGLSKDSVYLKKELKNGYIIDGNIHYYDKPTNTIVIPIILSSNRIAEIHFIGKDSPLTIELAVLAYLYGKPVNLAVIAVDRLYTHYRIMTTKLFNFISIDDYYSAQDIEQMLLLRTTELDKALQSKKIPAECEPKWHKKFGKARKMNCLVCHYSNNCKYYNNKATYTKINKNSIIF